MRSFANFRRPDSEEVSLSNLCCLGRWGGLRCFGCLGWWFASKQAQGLSATHEDSRGFLATILELCQECLGRGNCFFVTLVGAKTSVHTRKRRRKKVVGGTDWKGGWHRLERWVAPIVGNASSIGEGGVAGDRPRYKDPVMPLAAEIRKIGSEGRPVPNSRGCLGTPSLKCLTPAIACRSEDPSGTSRIHGGLRPVDQSIGSRIASIAANPTIGRSHWGPMQR